MSNPLEKSKNCSEEEKMVNYQSQPLHNILAKFLKLVISRRICQIRTPIQVEEAKTVADERGGALKKSTNKAGNDLLLTFELPQNCFVDKIDMDKLPKLEGNVSTTTARVFSFRQRLEGWNIELKQSENVTTCDAYYHHSESKQIMFRSASEVVKFMLYEIFPENPRKRKSPYFNAHFEKIETEAAEILASMGDHSDTNVNDDDGTENKAVFGGDIDEHEPKNSSTLDEEADLINHIPICQSMEELQEFLIENRRKGLA
ncbi:hypothetical protein G2W53_002392 [Senna tora]|uniref:Uncharacterized protein n=1 Tax=Senna tora TaxID=362788 RepID=A0A834XI00_9FABA|nr:hypothetical protein G2W53_002392 [Senna tora]